MGMVRGSSGTVMVKPYLMPFSAYHKHCWSGR